VGLEADLGLIFSQLLTDDLNNFCLNVFHLCSL
jgi:hypothetical protein